MVDRLSEQFARREMPSPIYQLVFELQMRYNDAKLNLRKDGGELTYEMV